MAKRKVLIWGAAKPPGRSGSTSALQLFPNGPGAWDFRTYLREQLRTDEEVRSLVEPLFSECWMESAWGHRRDNPGLYEPLQLLGASVVVLVLPANVPMAVNTWELTLACEEALSDREGQIKRLNALPVFVIPKTIYTYLHGFFSSAEQDPAHYQPARFGRAEPKLGTASSFAARWIGRAVAEPFRRLRSLPDIIIPYEDEAPWSVSRLGAPAEPTTQAALQVYVDLKRVLLDWFSRTS